MTIHLLLFEYNYIGVHNQLIDPVNIASGFPNGSLLYEKQSINIKCNVTHGTQILAWESEEYIGFGAQLVFSSTMMEGTIDYSEIMPETYAILTKVINEGGEVQIESELHLTVTSNKNFTIKCKHVDQYLVDTITFHISGKYV